METSVNNKCRAFTSLEQSRKLGVILPLESADMIWVLANPDLPMIKAIAYEDSDKNNKYYEILPAWSLAALLGVLPDMTCVYKKTYKDGRIKYQGVAGIIKELILKDNPIDACVAMIEKLNELKML